MMNAAHSLNLFFFDKPSITLKDLNQAYANLNPSQIKSLTSYDKQKEALTFSVEYAASLSKNSILALIKSDLTIITVDHEEGLTEAVKKKCFLSALFAPRDTVVIIHTSHAKLNEKTIKDIKAYQRFINQHYKLNSKFDYITLLSKPKIKKLNAVTNKTLWLDVLNKCIHKKKLKQSKEPLRIFYNKKLHAKKFEEKIVSGNISIKEKVRMLPSGFECEVKKIYLDNKEVARALTSQTPRLIFDKENHALLEEQIISASADAAEVANQFEVSLAIYKKESIFVGRKYLLKRGSHKIEISVVKIKNVMDYKNLGDQTTSQLTMNHIGRCVIASSENFAFDPYENNRHTGSFSLLDFKTKKNIGEGIIHFALRRSKNIQNQYFEINKELRGQLNQQKPMCLWFTGLSGSGKSAIANALEKELFKRNKRTYILDGDNIRHGINYDLGFSEEDRVENVRRVAEIAKLMVDAGLIVIVTFISPFEKDRQMARSKFSGDEFFEIYISTPLSECEKRDPKGLYRKARLGEIKNFTGIHSRYEEPMSPNIVIDSSQLTIAKSTDKILKYLKAQ